MLAYEFTLFTVVFMFGLLTGYYLGVTLAIIFTRNRIKRIVKFELNKYNEV